MRLAVWSLIGSLALLTTTDDKNFGKCPISGKPAIKEQSVDYLGKKVYFCCENCPGSFDKVKHAYKANLQLLETKQMMQVGCPISGAKVNKDQMVDVEGQKIGFCCEKCKAKYDEADADGKAKILFSNLKRLTPFRPSARSQARQSNLIASPRPATTRRSTSAVAMQSSL